MRTRQTSENQITEREMCGANKLTVNMVLILPREEGISLFGHGTFFNAMLSCFLLDSIRLVCLTKNVATFSSLDISRRT